MMMMMYAALVSKDRPTNGFRFTGNVARCNRLRLRKVHGPCMFIILLQSLSSFTFMSWTFILMQVRHLQLPRCIYFYLDKPDPGAGSSEEQTGSSSEGVGDPLVFVVLPSGRVSR